MTRPGEILSHEASRAKLEAAEKGTLFQSLTAIFTMMDLSGGFEGQSSEQAFYNGLGENIRKDYENLGCLDDYKVHAKIDPSVSNDDPQIMTAIENRCGQFWANIMRYQTPTEMRQAFSEMAKPAYEHLIQDGVQNWSELDQKQGYSIPAIETLVNVYHMSNKIANMLRTIEPDFKL